MLADARQIEHEGLLELELDLVLGLRPILDNGVEVAHLARAAEIVVQFADQVIFGCLPVMSDFGRATGKSIAQRGVDQRLVVVGPRLVVVLELRLHRRREDE